MSDQKNIHIHHINTVAIGLTVEKPFSWDDEQKTFGSVLGIHSTTQNVEASTYSVTFGSNTARFAEKALMEPGVSFIISGSITGYGTGETPAIHVHADQLKTI